MVYIQHLSIAELKHKTVGFSVPSPMLAEGDVALTGRSRGISSPNRAALDADLKVNLCLRVTVQITTSRMFTDG